MYHHNTFSIDTTFAFPVNMEGRYKVVVHVEAYDEMNIKRSKIICFQIFGEFIKSK